MKVFNLSIKCWCLSNLRGDCTEAEGNANYNIHIDIRLTFSARQIKIDTCVKSLDPDEKTGSTLFAILFLILDWNPFLHQ